MNWNTWVLPGQLQNVNGFIRVGIGDDGGLGGEFPDGEGDIGIFHIVIIGHHHGGVGHLETPVGFRVVQVSHHHVISLIDEVHGELDIRHQDGIRPGIFFQAFHQADGNGVVTGKDDMVAEIFRQFPGNPKLGLGFEPGGVEKGDKGKGQHNQKKYYPGEHHDDGKYLAQIAGEGDVSEP
jgi:hypothetical protein